jgi:ribonucleotide monophosphatase NagD (HAD superfamily)
MGQRAGMASALVLTGATTATDLARTDVHPDYVIGWLAELIPAPFPDPDEEPE